MAYSASEVTRIGLSGGEALVKLSVTPDSASGNFTISDASEVVPLATIALEEDGAGGSQGAVQVAQNGSTSNQIDCKVWKSPGSAGTTWKDFGVLAKIVT